MLFAISAATDCRSTTSPRRRPNARLKAHLGIEDDETLLRRLGCDIRRVSGRFVGPKDMVGRARRDRRGKGLPWRRLEARAERVGTYNEIAHHPLADVTTVKQVEQYAWPSVDWFDFSGLADEIDRVNRDERYCIMFFAGGSFETPWYMRGMERFLMDLVECPDIAEAISCSCDRVLQETGLRAIEESKGAIDLIGSGGDIGTQRGMMLAPDLWRKHIKPYSTQLIRTFKDMGLMTFYHSCGSIVPVIDDLIEMGLDILDPIQPAAKAWTPRALKTRFGNRLAFHGGIDEQDLLPNARPDQVRTEVLRLMSILGSDGGYIVCPAHAIQPDTPPENIMAIYDTVLGG